MRRRPTATTDARPVPCDRLATTANLASAPGRRIVLIKDNVVLPLPHDLARPRAAAGDRKDREQP